MRNGLRAVLDHSAGEVMHPVVGPRVEAEELYVAPSRLAARLTDPVTRPLVLLDVGLGAGSNASAAWRVALSLPSSARRLHIVSLDRHLDALRVAAAPEHAASFGLDADLAPAVRDLLDHGRHTDHGHDWQVCLGELPAVFGSLEPASADVVFWDPFSPKANPELWTVAAFQALRRLCQAGATVHTYSSATAARSALLLAGFSVGVGTPSGAKEQTTVAALCAQDLTQPLDQRWLERLQRSSAPLPADAPPNALDIIARAPQFTSHPASPAP